MVGNLLGLKNCPLFPSVLNTYSLKAQIAGRISPVVRAFFFSKLDSLSILLVSDNAPVIRLCGRLVVVIV